jgi:pimeloyl-ACP methyl ester carboxylesterase
MEVIVTVSDLEGTDPGAYVEAAANWRTRIAAAFQDQAAALQSTVIAALAPDVWDGPAAEAALSSLGSDHAELTATSDYLQGFGDLLQAASDGIAEARTVLAEAQSLARQYGLSISDDGTVGSVQQVPVTGTSASTQQGRIGEVQQLVTLALNDAARTIADLVPRLTNPEQFGNSSSSGDRENVAAGVRSQDAAQDAVLYARSVPVSGTASATVAAWWKAQSQNQQQALIKNNPAALGPLNGVSTAARNQANQILLADQIQADKSKIASIEAQIQQLKAQGRASGVYERGYAGPSQEIMPLTGELDALNRELSSLGNLQTTVAAGKTVLINGRPVHVDMYLMGFDTKVDGHAIVAVGDPDTARNVAVYVPGMNATLADVSSKIGDAGNMTAGADQADGAASTATIMWLGYNSPQVLDWTEPVLRYGDARAATSDLTGFVTSLRQVNTEISNLTLVGHSYGTLVVGEAAAASKLPVDNIVLVGSPGVGVDNAAQLNVNPKQVWVGANYDDPVAGSDFFGNNPASTGFGANQFGVQHGGLSGPSVLPLGLDSHSEYFDPGSESLGNISDIVAGRYGSVRLDHSAEAAAPPPRSDPLPPPPGPSSAAPNPSAPQTPDPQP